MATINGRSGAEFYWDNNGNNIIDNGDTGYIVSCPNYGHPYALLNVDSVPYIIRTWFRQDLSGNLTSLSRRVFWQGLIRPPVNKFNPAWYNVGLMALSLPVTEAFWAADDNNAYYPSGGRWEIGVGNLGYLSDGKLWPTGANVQYGRTIWHAKDIAPNWQVEQWYPPVGYYGVYSYTVGFSGF